MIFHEAYSGGEVIHKPPETTVVKIDQTCFVIINQKIGKPHIGMDQTIALW